MLRAPRANAAGAGAADDPPLRIAPATSEAIASTDELRFSNDAEPGIRRRRAGKGFYFVGPDNKRIHDEHTLARIRKLAIPPAYEHVWVCGDEKGHIQATGIDARGRKQYRYHARWRAVRDAHKFERMIAFGKALPRIHRRVSKDLKLPGLARDRVLATVVKLLELTLIRVGNDEYARDNKSYGLTTIRDRHVKLQGDHVTFNFRGKHGIQHQAELQDPRIARVLRRCLELPGQDLFEYLDDKGNRHDITSSDVNHYLKDITGQDFTAKDFRTWYATSSALETLVGQPFETVRESKAKLKQALENVAGRLRNTVSMCRKCYVNPVVVDAFLAGELRELSLGKGGDERVRLLHLLTSTPAGAGFERALSKPPKKSPSTGKGRARKS